MGNEVKNVPELRFPEFAEEYEFVELGAIGSFYSGLSGKSKEDFSSGNDVYIEYINVYRNLLAKNDGLRLVKIHEGEKQNSVKHGDLLFTGSSETLDEVGLCSTWQNKEVEPYLNSFCFGFRPKNFEQYSSIYLSIMLRSPETRKKIINYGQGSTRYNLSTKRLAKLQLCLPSKIEQDKVSEFFSFIDNQIANLEMKISLLEKQKIQIMHDIFDCRRRFSRPDGSNFPDWKEQKLENAITRITTRNTKLTSSKQLTISAELGLINQDEFFNKIVASKDLSNYYLLSKGDFAYNKSYSGRYPWGAIKRLEKYENGVVSSLYICFRINQGYYSDFMKYYFETSLWHKQLSLIAGEGARNHGLLNVPIDGFFNTTHYFPEYDEQVKIGDFMSEIDTHLSENKRILEQNKIIKKTLMQKMFI